MLCVCLATTAQNPDRFCIQTLHPEGVLYFVLPRKMPEMNGICRKPLYYDYTNMDASDSVSLLMTVTAGRPLVVDSLQITTSLKEYRHRLERIYCKPVKRGWEYRFRSTIDYKEWERMYRESEPFILTLSSTKENLRLDFSDVPRKWEKIRNDFIDLQTLIQLNR